MSSALWQKARAGAGRSSASPSLPSSLCGSWALRGREAQLTLTSGASTEQTWCPWRLTSDWHGVGAPTCALDAELGRREGRKERFAAALFHSLSFLHLPSSKSPSSLCPEALAVGFVCFPCSECALPHSHTGVFSSEPGKITEDSHRCFKPQAGMQGLRASEVVQGRDSGTAGSRRPHHLNSHQIRPPISLPRPRGL